MENKVAVVRDLDLDVAIDLSGWTSGHFLGGFLARLAPVQCNYLGFFASTGSTKSITGLVIGAYFRLTMQAGIETL